MGKWGPPHGKVEMGCEDKGVTLRSQARGGGERPCGIWAGCEAKDWNWEVEKLGVQSDPPPHLHPTHPPPVRLAAMWLQLLSLLLALAPLSSAGPVSDPGAPETYSGLRGLQSLLQAFMRFFMKVSLAWTGMGGWGNGAGKVWRKGEARAIAQQEGRLLAWYMAHLGSIPGSLMVPTPASSRSNS